MRFSKATQNWLQLTHINVVVEYIYTREVEKEEDKRENIHTADCNEQKKKQLYALMNHPLFALKQRTELKNLNLIA